jgi:hypothetical protein
VSGGVLSNTPTLGSQLHTEANAASDPNSNEANALTGWLTSDANNTHATDADASVGSYAIKSTVSISVGGNRQQYTLTLPINNWFVATFAQKKHGGADGAARNWNWGNCAIPQNVELTTSYANYAMTNRASAANPVLRFYTGNTVGGGVFIDNVSIKQQQLATLFASINARLANVNLIAPPISAQQVGTQSGIVLRLDSVTNPTNFVIAYVSGIQQSGYANHTVVIEKCVNGTYTTLSTVVAAYGATKYFSAKANGTSISIYYGTTNYGTLIATVTVSDATVVNNTRHGLFSTYSGNQFAGTFSVVPYA